MPGVVHAGIPDASRLEQCVPFRPVSMSTDRTAVGLAPDKIAVFPCWPGDQAFFQLGSAMRSERRHQLRRKRYWFYGAGGMHPVPPVSHWQEGLRGPPITWAVVSTATRPALISPWRKSRKALSSSG